MPFRTLDAYLPRLDALPIGESALVPLPNAPIGSFGDDIMLPSAQRLAVRVVARGNTEKLTLDFRDSDANAGAQGFGLDLPDVRLASVLAVCEAMGVDADARWLDRLDVLTNEQSWVGGTAASDPGRRAMSLARAYDAIMGALAASWPTRVGAGSCTVGALVELVADDELLCEAIAGGEGATPTRNGRAGWTSPVLGTVTTAAFVSWLSITQSSRIGSGGGGARVGGDGVERTYEVTRDVTAIVGLDRGLNPPHGIDRAGPPQASTAVYLDPDPAGEAQPVPPWTPFTLRTGQQLRIQTAGGAGHGFGGYGDIEFDPADWFGSTKTS